MQWTKTYHNHYITKDSIKNMSNIFCLFKVHILTHITMGSLLPSWSHEINRIISRYSHHHGLPATQLEPCDQPHHLQVLTSPWSPCYPAWAMRSTASSPGTHITMVSLLPSWSHAINQFIPMLVHLQIAIEFNNVTKNTIPRTTAPYERCWRHSRAKLRHWEVINTTP